MKRTGLRRRAPLRAQKPLRRTTPLRRTRSMAATEAQRAAVAGRACIVCGSDQRIDAAHLIPRSLGGCGDALCVTALCRRCHRAYDRGELDLLPYLEPAWRARLAHAVGHAGLIGALRRISGQRWSGGGEPGEVGVSFGSVSEDRVPRDASAVEDEEDIWARNERIRVAELRADSARPMGELLEAGVELSRFASELAAGARTES